ncbi:MAG: 30S ribosomal protein S17 [Bdellovibrionaceae bacterium]|nr:30S ribosomal protein S17 [Pseudobdellovibrionaceae bacterium]|tara:strand:+ start:448 stop:726 length:279 start_codon:yes stop_codon:yes gene_type:complete
MTEENKKSRGRLNQVIGQVISDKMDKTISVKIYRQVKHKKYGKYIRKSSVFKAHDEKNTAKMGDKVLITESRPMSKTKRWNLAKVIDTAAAE